MIELVNSWAQSIIISLIIAVIIEMILPESNNKKYVKVVLGMYILFSIVYPIETKFSKNSFSVNNIFVSTNKEIEKYKDSNVAINTKEYIENTYIKNIKSKIEKELEEKGYKAIIINLNIEAKNNEEYGKIKEIELKLQKTKSMEDKVNDINNKNNTNIINTIEEVNIVFSNNRIEKNNNVTNIANISDEDLNSIKDFLESTYSIKKDAIQIYTGG